MRGSIRERSKGSWRITLEYGYVRDPETGTSKRVQKFVTFHGTKRKAQEKLTDLLHEAKHGNFVEPSRVTLGLWLREWLEAVVKPKARPATYTRYRGIIENHLVKAATIADIPLQMLRPSHVESYYATAGVSPNTLPLHHTVLHRALRKAVKDRLVTVNVASDLETTPRRQRGKSEDARLHCWTAGEARQFLATAKADGHQTAALYAFALDTGARKGELCGLHWTSLDLDAGKARIVEQLTKPGAEPTFGPPKNGRPRTITLAAETVELLRVHKTHQARFRMKNRTTYHDFGLVFAKEWGDVRTRTDCLGQPLQANNLGERQFARLTKAAGVRRIKFHGLRHTCATLLLQAGQPAHVVAQRLGHSDVTITLNTYAHVLPDMQRDAAARLNSILYGR
jgi:integrase